MQADSRFPEAFSHSSAATWLIMFTVMIKNATRQMGDFNMIQYNRKKNDHSELEE